jgi:virginiamycin A acetyltransferase
MKAIAKTVLRALCLFLVFPLWAFYKLLHLAFGNAVFYGFSQLLSLVPGFTGNYLRHAFYRLSLARLGRDACIGFMATLSHPDTEIGAGAYVGPFCNLGLCSIGDDTLLGTGVHIMSGFGQHRHADLVTPIRHQGGTLTRVKVGEDCWIGNQAVVGADVGRKSIIGAASLVTKAIPEYSIAHGNPAKVVRDRRQADPAAAVP